MECQAAKAVKRPSMSRWSHDGPDQTGFFDGDPRQSAESLLSNQVTHSSLETAPAFGLMKTARTIQRK
jgi:hypothetical protein